MQQKKKHVESSQPITEPGHDLGVVHFLHNLESYDSYCGLINLYNYSLYLYIK